MYALKTLSGSGEMALGFRALTALPEDPGSQHLHGGSATPAPGDMASSSGPL